MPAHNSANQQIEPSTGNVFLDMGFNKPEALEKLIKSQLVQKISSTIQANKLTQKQAAHILGVSQPKVSALVNGELSGFSIDRLIRFASALGVVVSVSFEDRKSA